MTEVDVFLTRAADDPKSRSNSRAVGSPYETDDVFCATVQSIEFHPGWSSADTSIAWISENPSPWILPTWTTEYATEEALASEYNSIQVGDLVRIGTLGSEGQTDYLTVLEKRAVSKIGNGTSSAVRLTLNPSVNVSGTDFLPAPTTSSEPVFAAFGQTGSVETAITTPILRREDVSGDATVKLTFSADHGIANGDTLKLEDGLLSESGAATKTAVVIDSKTIEVEMAANATTSAEVSYADIAFQAWYRIYLTLFVDVEVEYFETTQFSFEVKAHVTKAPAISTWPMTHMTLLSSQLNNVTGEIARMGTIIDNIFDTSIGVASWDYTSTLALATLTAPKYANQTARILPMAATSVTVQQQNGQFTSAQIHHVVYVAGLSLVTLWVDNLTFAQEEGSLWTIPNTLDCGLGSFNGTYTGTELIPNSDLAKVTLSFSQVPGISYMYIGTASGKFELPAQLRSYTKWSHDLVFGGMSATSGSKEVTFTLPSQPFLTDSDIQVRQWGHALVDVTQMSTTDTLTEITLLSDKDLSEFKVGESVTVDGFSGTVSGYTAAELNDTFVITANYGNAISFESNIAATATDTTPLTFVTITASSRYPHIGGDMLVTSATDTTLTLTASADSPRTLNMGYADPSYRYVSQIESVSTSQVGIAHVALRLNSELQCTTLPKDTLQLSAEEVLHRQAVYVKASTNLATPATREKAKYSLSNPQRAFPTETTPSEPYFYPLYRSKAWKDELKFEIPRNVHSLKYVKLIGYSFVNKRQPGIHAAHETPRDDYLILKFKELDGGVRSPNRFADHSFAILHTSDVNDAQVRAVDYHAYDRAGLITCEVHGTSPRHLTAEILDRFGNQAHFGRCHIWLKLGVNEKSF